MGVSVNVLGSPPDEPQPSAPEPTKARRAAKTVDASRVEEG